MPKHRDEFILPGTKVDWKSYYEDFKAKHGGNPVLFEDRLLFQDGWRYSSTNYKGPEYPPPVDPWAVWALKIRYWEFRKKVAAEEIPQRQAMLERLENLERTHDATIPTRLWNPDIRMYMKESAPLDLSGLQGRIDWLTRDVEEAEEKLSELNTKTETLEGLRG